MQGASRKPQARNMQMARYEILLMAAYNLLKEAADGDTSHAVGIEVLYDGAMCDGYRLKADIATALGIEDEG